MDLFVTNDDLSGLDFIYPTDAKRYVVRSVTSFEQDQAILRVLAERDAQDRKWGSKRHLSNDRWSVILSEEVGEAAKEVLEDRPTALLDELVQVAAVAIAWIEALIAKRA